MNEENIYELGIDLSSSFTFHDGDLILSSYDDNLVQAVTNRIQTDLNELDLFYEDYGSILNSFFGWKANEYTIVLMKTEIQTN